MKKLSGFILALALFINILPEAQAVRGYRSLWIECEEAASSVSGDFKVSADGNASGRASLKLDSVNDGPHETAINFTLSYDEEYDIFILGSPGNTNWASVRKWKIDSGDYQAEISTNLGQVYSTADSRAAGVSWLKLTTQKLSKGSHSISFFVDQKRSMGNDFCYSILDTIAIVPSSWGWTPNGITTQPYDKNEIKMNYVSGTVPTEPLAQDDAFSVDVQFRLGAKTTGMPKIYAELVMNGETVSRDAKLPSVPLKSWSVGMPYTETFNLTIPFNVPDGEFEIRAGVENIDFEDGTPYATVGTVQVGETKAEEVIPYNAELSDISVPDIIEKGREVSVSAEIEFSREPDFETKPYLTLWKDGLLYEVLEGGQAVNKDSENVTFKSILESDLPAGEYEARAGLHYFHSESEVKKVTVTGTDPVRSRYHKPMSYGNYYSKKTGREQFWYINQVNAAFYNGEPYIPFGGMFVFTYITAFDANDPEGNKRRFEQDKADLDLIRASGVNDLYINPVRGGDSVPVWAWQYLLDYLEETGWYYGLQLNATSSNASEVFYPHATEASGQFMAENITKSGEVTLTASKSFAAGVQDTRGAVYVAVNNQTGEVSDSGLCSLTLDSDGNLLFSADVKLSSEGVHTVYFTPKIYGDMGAAINCWENPERYYDKLETFASKFELGDNLRMTVDLTKNEMGIYNAFESARVSSESFNTQFADWLSEKYHTVQALNNSWKTVPAIESFEEASKLIPVYTSNKDENNDSYSYFVHLETGKAYNVDTHMGVAWNDYLDARDDTFLAFNNKCADIVKQHLNVPVIFKHCSIQRRYFINKNTVGGIDGMGSEAYGPSEKIISMIGTTGSHSNQFARTAWNVITETNTEENVMGKYESGQWSYPSKEEFFTRFQGALDNGTKGIYDFLLADRHDLGGNLGDAYSWIINQDTIGWGAEFSKMIDEPEMQKKLTSRQYANDTFYFYPSQKNWWWKPNERGAVQLLDDTTQIQRLRTENGNHVLQTDSLDVDTRLIFVNLHDGPYTQIFGPDLSELIGSNPPDKRIVILGHRNDLGSIPEIDKYFTGEKADISADPDNPEIVQILKPTSTSTVLKTTADGKPWALQDGNICIISSDKFVTHEGEFGTLHYADELGFTDVSDLGGGDFVSYTGFDDMKNHWAADDVNYMKDLGIAAGVGDNKFNPEGIVTAAEFISLVTRIMQYPDAADEIDIPKDKWYYSSMAQAKENGIITDDMYKEAERAITREEMAAVAAKALGAYSSDFDLSVYSDAQQISQEFLEFVKIASENNLVYGMDDGTFSPKGNATRAQAIVIAKRLIEAVRI